MKTFIMYIPGDYVTLIQVQVINAYSVKEVYEYFSHLSPGSFIVKEVKPINLSHEYIKEKRIISEKIQQAKKELNTLNDELNNLKIKYKVQE